MASNSLRSRNKKSTEDDHSRDSSDLSVSDDSGMLQTRLDKCELKDSGVRLDVKPKSKITLTLDVLVADKIQQDELDRMNRELQADLKCGGVSNMLAELNEPDGMLPEHKKQLEMLSNFPQHNINELPPWETLFEASNYCCLFNSDLQLSHIKFLPGNSKIDNTLANTEGTEQLEFILKSDILRIVWYAVSNKNLVLRWLFFLMSIHNDVSVSEACYQIILNAIQLQLSSSRTKNTWAPDIADILRIFINYGAPVHDLVPNQAFLRSLPLGALQKPINTNCKHTKQDKSSTTTSSPRNADSVQLKGLQDAASAPKLRKSDKAQFNSTGLVYVLSVLSFVLDSRPYYTTDQLSALFLMLCKVRLDIHIATDPLVKNLQAVLSRIIQKFPAAEWPQTAINLSIDLTTLTRDPHNMLFLTQTLPHCQQSVELRQRLATLQLYVITEQNISTISKEDVNISQLFCLFPHLKSFAQNKLSTLSVTVDLLSIAVGGSSLQKSDRENLQQVMHEVMQLSECLRDNGRTVACSVVKNKLVILSNRWKIFLETIGLTQKNLFAWTRIDRPQESIETASEEMAICEEIILSDSDSTVCSDSGSLSDCSIFSLPEI
ncbi:SMC5-SMC6 complex localization factor protein 2 isoform X2 [Octopus bimaculoides]|nr:SMC5-SMC6 complex localization factor protein 2 isoform X2 [Octopus bimaculoides]XP_014776238.1 SMC5-SMC6 complex localization factor protein 2 isoform X2 [Octopus bimaculoides]XP_014776239.1 SMC5-SMC6 complex localization factor protein 2 isoform X2 [Octopus bimaculoides]|eukprot:XP_014776237.1 PREDICTED: SMC5-SMC6 complex localization factor protein 2-like isoform X3 [Octopus bimaculoides]